MADQIRIRRLAGGPQVEARLAQQALRERWVHEDTLISLRMNWLIGAETIAFTGVAILSNSSGSDQGFAHLLALPIGVIGFVLAISSYIGILAARHAMISLKHASEDIWSMTGRLTKVDVDVESFTTKLGWISAIMMPMAFVFSWVLVASLTIWKARGYAWLPIVGIPGCYVLILMIQWAGRAVWTGSIWWGLYRAVRRLSQQEP